MSDRPVHEQIKDLSNSLVLLSDKVLKNFSATLDAFADPQSPDLETVRQAESEIDVNEVRLEEQCLAFLALQQPVARDLRKIITIVKINNDLERIGDLSMHICDRLADINPEVAEAFQFRLMGEKAKEMIQMSIQAFVNADRVMADEVLVMDEEVDAMHRAVFKKVAAELKSPDADTAQLILALSMSRYIERMGDHATRIAQEVIYLITGEIIRHTEGSFEKLIQSLKD
ncbi:phosphate signaling complex protein PhoU [Prosthecochloris sp. N3]|uniref:Phosphate-specific transport system accessory protein PhoU n=1 Tax=Prosthecochloris ethylica TaxID=2743976 RepID=A0ABR9XPB9_9CHLB|nr:MULTISPECIES: phosphate signaling complex protein PhoU [Prosthecochloris]MBF0586162.1 phosphate signaling complex protein PhoU [Prosthecochloris ethylica]MBF0635868.1 phosphate signaling complex protein PhoU [Prosthecochloris ethylica]NUK47457.1 phosphate signaling complex protein PhoU [Prosthecochloris ethylica]RNA65005.1 phosphate signaling complex protein PhoU [Prosthecochloris sp. ZM_2]